MLIENAVIEVMSTCDRVLHMRAGRIVEAVVPGRIAEREVEERVYA